MREYIFLNDVQVVKGNEIKKYTKGDMVSISDPDVRKFKDLGVVREYNKTVKQIKEELDELGVEYPYTARKAELIETLKGVLNDTE